MIHIDPLTNSPEPRSPKGAWMAIHDRAPYKKEKARDKKNIISFSKVHRYPEESSRRTLNPAVVARKMASAARIEKSKNAAKRYKLLLENPECKIQSSSAGIYIQPRENGRFKKRIFLNNE